MVRPNHPRERKQSLLLSERDTLNEVSRFMFYAIRLLDKLGHEVGPPVHDDHYRSDIAFICTRCFKRMTFDLITLNHGNKVWRLLTPAQREGISYNRQYVLDYHNPQEGIDFINQIDYSELFCTELPECYISREDFKTELGKIPDALSRYFQHCFLHAIRFKYIVKGYLTQGSTTYTRARTCSLEGRCKTCQMTFGARIEGSVMTFMLGGTNGKSIPIEKSGSTPYPTEWLESASRRIRNETNITLKHPDYAHFSCTRLEILK